MSVSGAAADGGGGTGGSCEPPAVDLGGLTRRRQQQDIGRPLTRGNDNRSGSSSHVVCSGSGSGDFDGEAFDGGGRGDGTQGSRGDAGGCPECRARWRAASPSAPAPHAAAAAAEAPSQRGLFGSTSAGPSAGRFTVCDVARHGRLDDVWLIAHGRVFDVTPFVAEHPGGREALARHAGRVCDVDFDFHSGSAQRTWDKYQVGTVVPCAGYPRGSGSSGGGCAVT